MRSHQWTLTNSTNWDITEKEADWGNFHGYPVVKTRASNAVGTGLLPGGEFKIPHTSRPKSQNIKQKQYCKKNSVKT